VCVGPSFFFFVFFLGMLVDRIALAEQNDGDIAGEKESLEEAKAGIAKLHKELDKLGDEVAASEVLIILRFR
jgi:hypothetical protein